MRIRQLPTALVAERRGALLHQHILGFASNVSAIFCYHVDKHLMAPPRSRPLSTCPNPILGQLIILGSTYCTPGQWLPQFPSIFLHWGAGED
jgi:hypothetical protein